MNNKELEEFLNEKFTQYNTPSFIDEDPISIPHFFTKKEDIEISGFLAATIAWGQRKTIVKNARQIVELMDFSPYEFVVNSTPNDRKIFSEFKHRTFNGVDLTFFLESLQKIYHSFKSLENLFLVDKYSDSVKDGIINFRQNFFSPEHPHRTEKHVSNPAKGSAAKRLNMFLRWMVRNDNSGVDFGIWKNIKPSKLIIPLDVHTGNVGRKIGLLSSARSEKAFFFGISFKYKGVKKIGLSIFGFYGFCWPFFVKTSGFWAILMRIGHSYPVKISYFGNKEVF